MHLTEKTNICGINFDNITIDELRDILAEKLKGEPHNYFIVTPNVDFIIRATRDYEFNQVIDQADLSLCDSAIVKGSSRMVGCPIKEKITGSDLLREVCSGLTKNTNCFMLGSTKENIKLASKKLSTDYTYVNVVGSHDGFFSAKDNQTIVEKINAAHTEVLIVGMGSPRQEAWIAQNSDQLRVKIIICVGGVIDILAGKVQRAPVWMQNTGLEWSWRLMQDPRRLWKRYLIDDMYFFKLLWQSRKTKQINHEKVLR